jgi:hypothetical protein
MRQTRTTGGQTFLPHGKAQVEKVASNLSMSNRTLARRLSEEGTSYAV